MSALRQKHLVRVIFSEMYFLLKSVMHNTIREGALTSRGRRSPGYEIVSYRYPPPIQVLSNCYLLTYPTGCILLGRVPVPPDRGTCAQI